MSALAYTLPVQFWTRTLDSFADEIITKARRAEDGRGWYASLDVGPKSWVSDPDFAGYGKTEAEARAYVAARIREDAKGIGKYAPHSLLVPGYDFHWRLCKYWALKETLPRPVQPSDDFVKTVRLGVLRHHDGEVGRSVFCKIEYKAGRLSITGVHGPTAWGGARSCGQITDLITETDAARWNLAPGWSWSLAIRFASIWRRWHLNDMNAGTPRQQEALRAAEKLTPPAPGAAHYDWALAILTERGLQPDLSHAALEISDGKGYSYGSKWLREEVPTGVLEWLRALPDTDKTPRWR